MRTFEVRHNVPHSAEDMFALVADVERYPEFVPLCESLQVRSRTTEGEQEILIADMTVAYKMFRETFTSRVTLNHPQLRIEVEYLSGPFRQLDNRWHFLPLADGRCDVDFYLAYEFKSRTFQLLMGSVFDAAFAKFLGAFERRADQIYGVQTTGV